MLFALKLIAILTIVGLLGDIDIVGFPNKLFNSLITLNANENFQDLRGNIKKLLDLLDEHSDFGKFLVDQINLN